MMSRQVVRSAICAIVLSAVAVGAPAARAATTTVQPSPAEARTFATSNGGWASAVDFGGLVCIPGVTCPTANPSFQGSNGAGGVGDGYLRSSFGTLLGVLSTTTISWTSPAFAAPSSTDAVNLSLSVRPQIASLLAIGSVQLKASIVNSVTSAVTPLASIPLTAASASFGAIQTAVPTSAFTAGNSYKLRIGASITTNISAVTSGNVDVDNISLTFADADLPSDLTAAVPTSGPSRVTGTVDPHGTTTAVTVDYGTTAAYGTTTSAVNVTGTGSQAYSVPLTGLTPGTTYHYRVTAQNDDGSVSTTDDTFVAPSLPSSAAPTAVSGADNSRNRTVTFARAASVAAATIEILGAGATVLDSVDDTDADGSVDILLPDADGTYDLRVVRESDAGLTATSSTVPALLDRSAPSLTGLDLTVTPALSTSAQRSVSFTRPSDADSVSAQVIDADGHDVGSATTVNAGTADVQLGSTDGSYRVRLTLTDAVGNSVSTTSDPVTLDTTAPDPGSAPTVNGDGNSRDRTVEFTRDPSTASADIELLDAGSAVIQTVAVPTGASGAIQLPDADGEYAVRVKQSDAAGNHASSPQKAIALDRVAPSLTGLELTFTPELSAASQRSVSFTRPSDAHAVKAQVIDADGHDVGSPVTVNAGTADVQLGSADGEYRVRLTLTDAAGNSASATSDPVTLDTTAPEAPTAPTAAGTPDALDVIFDRASDAATVKVNVRAVADGALIATIDVPTGNHTTVVLPEAEGEYEITVVQTDQAGNSTTTPPLKVTRKRAETEPKPQAPAQPEPQAPATDRPSAPAPQAPAAQPARCPRSAVVLTRVARAGVRVNIRGWSARPARTKVTITDLTGKPISTATVNGRGRFAIAVDAPSTAAARQAAGYRAVIDGAQSPAVMLQRGNKLAAVHRSGETVTLHGRIKAGHIGTLKQVRVYAKSNCAAETTLLRSVGKLVVDRRAGTYTLRAVAPAGQMLIISTEATGTKGTSTSVFQVR
jgi:hypothetical protein